MRIVPDSTITLYSGVEVDDGEQLAFSSVQGQNAYFATKLVAQQVPCTVVRKTGTLRVEIAGSIVAGCNYLSFINPSFDNKKIYAHITDYEYVNNECVEIAYEIDAWQTWMFDVTYQVCFIEREYLSQSDWQAAENNPYDPDILELRTAETLPIGQDLEKSAYTIGTGANVDGSKLGDIVGIDPTLGVLIKTAFIDFKSLDAAATQAGTTPTPGAIFSQYLANIINNGSDYSFFYLPQDMVDYLRTTYPTPWGTLSNQRFSLASGWTVSGGTVYPCFGSSYRPQACYIYDGNGGTQFGPTAGNYMSTFLSLMTTISGGDPSSVIIDMSLIPNNIMFLGGRLDDGTALATTSFGIRSAKSLGVVNHKLMRYPFAYGRLIAPNGDIKEFRFEDFINIQENEDVGYMAMLLDISDRPVFIVAPIDYKIDGMNDENTNIVEGLFMSQFPSMPYTVDAFQAQVAAMANESLGKRTIENAADLAVWKESTKDINYWSGIAEKIGGAAGAFIGGLTSGGLAGGITGGINAISGLMSNYKEGAEFEMSREKYKAAEQRWNDAGSGLTPGGGAIADQLRLTKPAYACHQYHPSNGIGTTNFTAVSFCDIIALCVNLQPTILSLYDDYFTLYGYNSGRCGIPRVINYITGSGDMPHWNTLGDQQITYVKTMDLKVIHSLKPVANAIKAMFDNGVRFIKGD